MGGRPQSAPLLGANGTHDVWLKLNANSVLVPTVSGGEHCHWPVVLKYIEPQLVLHCTARPVCLHHGWPVQHERQRKQCCGMAAPRTDPACLVSSTTEWFLFDVVGC